MALVECRWRSLLGADDCVGIVRRGGVSLLFWLVSGGFQQLENTRCCRLRSPLDASGNLRRRCVVFYFAGADVNRVIGLISSERVVRGQ